MDKIDVVKYLDMAGEMRTISYKAMDSEALDHEAVIWFAEENGRVWRAIQAYQPLYIARKDNYWYRTDLNGLETTPEWAVYWAVPWRALDYWGDAQKLEVIDTDIWAKVLQIRKDEEAKAAANKAARAKFEAERREKKLQAAQAFWNKIEAGEAATKRTKGAFVLRNETGEPLEEVQGYIVTTTDGQTLPMGLSGSTGHWRLTHIPSGHYITTADTLKRGCAIAWVIYNMAEPEQWAESDIDKAVPHEKQKQIRAFIIEYRGRR